jgi:hypothetical protein
MNKKFEDHLFSRNDNRKNLGFNYKGKIFRNTLSSAMYLEEKRASILDQIERLVYFMIEYVKNIKKSYNYTFDKNFNKFN